MSIATATLSDLRTAYVAVAKLEEALRDYNQGTAAPATQLGRFTVAEVDERIEDAEAALDAIIAFSSGA